jgi:DNA helicase-2/ATP-dependent DNA helicase PcrA
MTEEQLAAAQAGPVGAFLIGAGPGTGKTFTMVERYRWLVEKQDFDPAEILAITFTEAAAGELHERLEKALGQPLDQAWIGTFHGICLRLLRDHTYEVGIAREVRVLDDIGQRLLVEQLRADLRNGAEVRLDRELATLNSDEEAEVAQAGPLFGLKLKGKGILPAEFRRLALEMHARAWTNQADDPAAQAERESIEVLYASYEAYQRRLRQRGLMDFDDLILTVIEALRALPNFRQKCHQQFRQILVDEFQDTNRIQMELIRLLSTADFANVTVVGDAKQSIYGWRDAEIENIRTRFPGRRLLLTRNWRSYQEILDLANDFIRLDPGFAQEPSLVAERGSAPGGRRVSVVAALEARLEARHVAGEIRRLVGDGRRLSEIAILTSSVRHLPAEFEDELRLQGIPYITTASSGFFDREEIKDVLALLRLVADPMDDGALVRVLQGPLVRLGDEGLYRLALRRLSHRWGMRLRDCLDASQAEGWPEVPPAVAARIERALAVIAQLGEIRDGVTIGDLLGRLVEETGYLRHCQLRALREGPRPVHNLRQMAEMAARYERDDTLAGIADFVTYLDQVMEAGIPVAQAEATESEAVQLLTIHAAKGLEFGIVFLVNLRPAAGRELEKFYFEPDSYGFLMKWWRGKSHPRYRQHEPGDKATAVARQEQRRKVYVALTRARDWLYVSATRAEEELQPIAPMADDFFAEILQWARMHPKAATVVRAEKVAASTAWEPAPTTAADPELVDKVVTRLELLQSARAATQAPTRPPAIRLSFTQLHQFEICPQRYRFQHVWEVPAPPDELHPVSPASGIGSAVHEAIALWHREGGDLLSIYKGPDEGCELLENYLHHPLASSKTLGTEVEFNLLLDRSIRVKGLVDRICQQEGRTVLIDYKTNVNLDARLHQAYAKQLQLYALAARRELLPGSADPVLVLFDLRQSKAIEIEPDDQGVERQVLAVAEKISQGNFELGAEHTNRPCFHCSYRPLCPQSRL